MSNISFRYISFDEARAIWHEAKTTPSLFAPFATLNNSARALIEAVLSHLFNDDYDWFMLDEIFDAAETDCEDDLISQGFIDLVKSIEHRLFKLRLSAIEHYEWRVQVIKDGHENL